jgi:hypothetical protein
MNFTMAAASGQHFPHTVCGGEPSPLPIAEADADCGIRREERQCHLRRPADGIAVIHDTRLVPGCSITSNGWLGVAPADSRSRRRWRGCTASDHSRGSFIWGITGKTIGHLSAPASLAVVCALLAALVRFIDRVSLW